MCPFVSLSVKPVRVIYVVACICSLSLVIAEQSSIVRIYKEYQFSKGWEEKEDSTQET